MSIALLSPLILVVGLIGLGPSAASALDAREIDILGHFARLVNDHRNLSSTSTETSGTLWTRDVLADFHGVAWDQIDLIRARIRATLAQTGTDISTVADLYLRLIDDLSRDGRELNRLLLTHPELRPRVEDNLSSLLFRADYEFLVSPLDLYARDYPEPLNSVITPPIARAFADIFTNQRTERHILSVFVGLGFMSVVELTALGLRMGKVIHVEPTHLIAGIPVLIAAGWAACQALLARRRKAIPRDLF